MNKYKYLHIFWWDDTKFYKSLVDMIDSEDLFIPSEHYFITPFSKVYESIKEYPNVELVHEDGLSLLLKYGKQAEWIFCHPIHLPFYKYLLIPKSIAKKIIWRTWGHDIRKIEDWPYSGLKLRIAKLLYPAYKKKVASFKLIGVANEVDRVNVEKVFGNKIRTMQLPYGEEKIDQLKTIIPKQPYVKGDCLKILIGHNGNVADRHIEVLQALSCFADKDIKVYIALAYGADPKYISEVKEKAFSIYGLKAIFLEKFMDYRSFALLIANCDICIFDNLYSNGLGSLSLIAYFHRKLYVNRSGDIASALVNAGIKPNYTDEIQQYSFESFCEADCEENTRLIQKVLGPNSRKQDVNLWIKALEYLGGGYAKLADPVFSYYQRNSFIHAAGMREAA